jgi:hypothetical protein
MGGESINCADSQHVAARRRLMRPSPAAKCRPFAQFLTTTGGDPRPPTHHLNQIELARRWRISPRTLERWRWLNQGPAYLKIGGRVVYRLEDIEAFEAAQAHG